MPRSLQVCLLCAIPALLLAGEAQAQSCLPIGQAQADMRRLQAENARAVRAQDAGRVCDVQRRALRTVQRGLVFMRANVGSCGITADKVRQMSGMTRDYAATIARSC